ncbi:MAG: DUF763 domain-containing protein, partial [bacterium]|nr:DUF763 domain-containing protein [bacterium]MDW8163503.1 DUF763 domain-containing protein [Candidatus Omnitrophota bacterium]
MKRNIADLPLHYGSAPKYLFERQKKILFEIGRLIIMEFGTEEFLLRLSDPLYFQILGCISGFDWHSSGVTTTVCYALKEVFNKNPEYGVFIFGGKGKKSIETPDEIKRCKYIEKKEQLIYLSKFTAKVDNNCIQDGYQLYHHNIFVDVKGNWVVIQQGMNLENKYARRYHWFNKLTNSKDENFVIEPHTGIISQKKEDLILNLVDEKSEKLQSNLVEYLNIEKLDNIMKLLNNNEDNIFNLKIERKIKFPSHHYVKTKFDNQRLYLNLYKLKEKQIKSFVDIIMTEGVGIKTLRALCLISEIVYGDCIWFDDPAKFSFAFGGKDGYPYPVDKKN